MRSWKHSQRRTDCRGAHAGAKRGIDRESLRASRRWEGSEASPTLEQFNHYWERRIFWRRHRAVRECLDGIDSAFAQGQLNGNQRVVVYGVPGSRIGRRRATPKAPEKDPSKNNGEPVNADAGWRNEPAEAGPASALHLPVPEKFQPFDGLTSFTAKAGIAAGGG